MDFQREGIQFAIKCDGRCLIADEVSEMSEKALLILLTITIIIITNPFPSNYADGFRQDVTSHWCDGSVSRRPSLPYCSTIICQVLMV